MRAGRIVLGLGLLALGGLLLAGQAGWVDAPAVVATWWPVLVVVLGVAQLAERPRGARSGPWVVVGIGVALLALTTGVLPFGLVGTLGPLALIALGLVVLLGRSRPRRRRARTERAAGGAMPEVVATFGDRHAASGSATVAGGEVTAVFGDASLDLAAASLDDDAEVGATAVFGDVRLLVPAHWVVEVTGPVVFGDLDDGGPPLQASEQPPRLRVRVVAVFGDVAVERVVVGART